MAKKRRFLLIFAVILLGATPQALALKVFESDRFFVYFPEGAESLAEGITEWCKPMAAFLSEQGLPIRKTIHIMLDEELDQPAAITQLYPHREIRLPLRAPGALEDGYTESQPWRYFLFKGLCALGIYSERSGIPGGAYHLFGEIIAPNAILPDWTIDGISHLLWEHYTLKRTNDPLSEAIFNAGPIPGLDRVSHHPEIWPGRFSYRIYGRTFIRWLYERFGWNKLLQFLRLHGRGIIPIEIDLKAKRAFGLTWNQLWDIFQAQHSPIPHESKGVSIVGYWDAPYFYWNEAGVYPGIVQPGIRSRHGFMDKDNWLWLSEYVSGASMIKIQRRGALRHVTQKHVWDPGPGPVAVTRKGYQPVLVIFGQRRTTSLLDGIEETVPVESVISGPPKTLQMSGPVMDSRGRIAVAANTAGNWDIWIFDNHWYRLTNAPSIEIDPWWIDGKLVFSSNSTGRFQIHGSDFKPLTRAPVAALLPRNETCLYLDASGFRRQRIDPGRIPVLAKELTATPLPPTETARPNEDAGDYSAWKSLWPNFIEPDYFFNTDNFQLGLATRASDVSRNYSWNAGIRYEPDDEEISWRLGYHAKSVSSRLTRYPFSSSPQKGVSVDEMRLEANVSWSPESVKALSLAANWQRFSPDDNRSADGDIWWAAIGWHETVGTVHTSLKADIFNDGSQSLYGDFFYRGGENIHTILRLQGGKSWGEVNPGRNTFRIGGNADEGFFTQRSSRLFPVRGFDSGIIDDQEAISAGLAVLWPFAKLQTGYKTLPLFLHNITLETFIDAGYAGDHFDSDDILIGAGVELITGIQMAWESKSHFRIGLAWPLRMPDDIQQDGPTFLILIGRPL